MKSQSEIHVDYIFSLLELLERKGISPVQLCDTLDITLPKDGYVDLNVVRRLISHLQTELNIANPGYLLGCSLSAGMHGHLGYALKSCKTALDALRVDETYINTRLTALNFAVTVTDNDIVIDLSFNQDVGDLYQFFIELVIFSIRSFYAEIFTNSKIIMEVSTTYLRPQAGYANVDDNNWSYGAASNFIKIPRSIGERTLSSADEMLLKLSIEQCAKQKQAFKNTHSIGYARSIRRTIVNDIASPPTIIELANNFGISERTLRRQLNKEATSYNEIVRSAREERAKDLLRTTPLTIDDIASILGYESPNTFKRLFKEWAELTPGQYRKLVRQPPQ